MKILNGTMDLSTPKIMGIINLTADSFFDGGKIKSDLDLLRKVERMTDEGVDILDVGAYSSRPGAADISFEQEQKHTEEGIDLILKHFPDAVVSLDTFRAEVARNGIDHGAQIVNDISGGNLDDNMFSLIAEKGVTYIMMHMRGNPQTMMNLTHYENLVEEVISYFNDKVKALQKMEVKEIVLDPGFGFAKTRSHNFELLNHLDQLMTLGLPILCGVSRKSMIFKTLNITPDQALNGTSALNMTALMHGATILRVHDVKAADEVVQLFTELKNN